MNESASPSHEPRRIAVNKSLLARPFFAGVDKPFLFFLLWVAWSSFLIFKLTLTLVIILVCCFVLFLLVKWANRKDQWFLPILVRHLTWRVRYAACPRPLETRVVCPSIPAKVVRK